MIFEGEFGTIIWRKRNFQSENSGHQHRGTSEIFRRRLKKFLQCPKRTLKSFFKNLAQKISFKLKRALNLTHLIFQAYNRRQIHHLIII